MMAMQCGQHCDGRDTPCQACPHVHTTFYLCSDQGCFLFLECPSAPSLKADSATTASKKKTHCPSWLTVPSWGTPTPPCQPEPSLQFCSCLLLGHSNHSGISNASHVFYDSDVFPSREGLPSDFGGRMEGWLSGWEGFLAMATEPRHRAHSLEVVRQGQRPSSSTFTDALEWHFEMNLSLHMYKRDKNRIYFTSLSET